MIIVLQQQHHCALLSQHPQKGACEAYDEQVPIFFLARNIVFHIVTDEITTYRQQAITYNTVGNSVNIVYVQIRQNDILQQHP